MSADYFVGVDVGTGSVRAALFTSTGKSVKWHKQDIQIYNPLSDHYEQSSEEIWNACLCCIKTVTQGIDNTKIHGLGFDATCSLVVLDNEGKPLSVSTSGNNNQNVILWMDHRASLEAEEINKSNNPLLKYVGGKISLEMQTPKLMWLKRNLKQTWMQAGHFFDLPDFLTFKSTGSKTRSLCSLVCKWTYEVNPEKSNRGWSEDYFTLIGLEDLIGDNWRKIGSQVRAPGTPVGSGLSEAVAQELGLRKGTAVGTSIIDAHAGGLGIVGCHAEAIPQSFNSKLALICGTSTCHMAVSEEPIFVKGVWGPYYSAMIPGMWLNEGGQSATGQLIDHVIESHPVFRKLNKTLGNKLIQDYLNDLLEKMSKKNGFNSPSYLTKDFHVLPDFRGNRSPVADPNLKGMISGMQIGNNEEDLAITYLATLQGLAYGTKHIFDELQKSGHRFSSVVMCGGLSKNRLYVQTQADVLNVPAVIPEEKEPVLLGAAILGASAAKYFESLDDAAKKMSGNGTIVYPDERTFSFHRNKYRVFLKMLEDQIEYRRMMRDD